MPTYWNKSVNDKDEGDEEDLLFCEWSIMCDKSGGLEVVDDFETWFKAMAYFVEHDFNHEQYFIWSNKEF